MRRLFLFHTMLSTATTSLLLCVLLLDVDAWFLHGSQRQRHRQQSHLLADNNNNDNNDNRNHHASLFDVAAGITQDSCLLLGTKSLGIDYGLVRTGLAVTVGYDPEPLPTLVDLNTTQACHEIVQHATALSVDRLVVGLPLHKNGTVALQTNLTLAFAQALLATVLAELGPNIPVYLLDERYTSKLAKARTHSVHPGQATYGTLDAESACILLETYYESNGDDARQRLELEEKEVRDSCLQAYRAKVEAVEVARVVRLEEQEAKRNRRRLAMERGRLLEEANTIASAAGESNININKRKRKKKKKKKR